MAWDEDKKDRAVKLYTDANPTPETSIEILEDVAEALGETVNGVRRILTNKGVYIAKGGSSANSSTSSKKSGDAPATPRVSKEDAQATLAAKITALGKEADMDIISKLTGKAAKYISDILSSL